MASSDNKEPANQHGLPESFRPLLWSYKFEAIDPDAHYDEIIVNTVNYGSLKQWRWLISYYGKDRVKEVLEERWATEFNPESRNLAQLIFGVSHWRYGPRGAH